MRDRIDNQARSLMTTGGALLDWTAGDVELRRQAQVLIVLGVLGTLATLGGAMARLFINGQGIDVLLSMSFAPVGVLCPLLARRFRSVVVPSWMLLLPGTLVTMLVAYGEGGVYSPSAVWLPVMPLAATFLLGWVGGAMFLGLTMAMLWILTGAPPTEPVEPALWAVSATMSGTFAFACVAAFDLSRQAAHRKIGGLVLEAEARNTTLALANEQLELAHGQARAASELKSEFMTTMSHELRTPLNSIIGFSSNLLKNKSGNLHARDAKLLARIRTNGIDLLGLINDILDVSKIESGQLEFTIEPVALGAVCAHVMQVVEPLVADKGLLLRAEIPEGVTPIEADEQRLRQVLTNIVANAIKFTDAGSVTLRVVTEGGTGIPVRVEIEDTGIGIPKDRIEAVLEPFVQADGSTSKHYGGTGLGLSISRSLSERMGFQLRLRSVEGQGTTVVIELDPGGDRRRAMKAGSADVEGPAAEGEPG